MTTKTQLISELRTFVSQRSGIDSRDYASSWRDSNGIKALRSDQYKIKRDGLDARNLIKFIELRDSITVDDMLAHFKTGRLTWNDAKKRFDFCIGQYFPTEYRAAVCRALISIIMAWGCDKRNVFGNGTNFLQHQLGKGIAGRWHR